MSPKRKTPVDDHTDRDGRMSFDVFGVKIEARTPIAIILLVCIAAAAIFWYWPQIRERLPGNIVGTPSKASQLLCALRFSDPASNCSGGNEENVTRKEGEPLCIATDEPYRAVYYVFGLNPSSFSFSIRFKANTFEAPFKNNIVTLGEAYRWFSLRENLGRIEITANNQDVAQPINDAHITSGTWHNIFVSVDELKKQVVLVLDGVNSFDFSLPADFSFEVRRFWILIHWKPGFLSSINRTGLASKVALITFTSIPER